MTWRTRVGLAGWLAFGCFAWLAYPVLVATLLLWGLVAAMLTLAVLAMTTRRAKRRRR